MISPVGAGGEGLEPSSLATKGFYFTLVALALVKLPAD